jgi:hypothetical protein
MITRSQKKRLAEAENTGTTDREMTGFYDKIGQILEKQVALARQNSEKRDKLEARLMEVFDRMSEDHGRILELQGNMEANRNKANKIINKLSLIHTSLQASKNESRAFYEYQLLKEYDHKFQRLLSRSKEKEEQEISRIVNKDKVLSLNQQIITILQFGHDFYDFSIDNYDDRKRDKLFLSKNTYYENGRFKEKMVTEFLEYILYSPRFADFKHLFENPSHSLAPYYSYTSGNRYSGYYSKESELNTNPIIKSKTGGKGSSFSSISPTSDIYTFFINFMSVRYGSTNNPIYPPIFSELVKGKFHGNLSLCLQTIIGLIFDINAEFQLRGKKIIRYDEDTGNIYIKKTPNPSDIYHTFHNLEYFEGSIPTPPDYYYDDRIGYFKVYPVEL